MVVMTITASAQRGVRGKGGEPGYGDDGGSGWGGLILFFLIVGGIGYILQEYWKKQDSRKAEERRAKAEALKEKEARERKQRERKEQERAIIEREQKELEAKIAAEKEAKEQELRESRTPIELWRFNPGFNIEYSPSITENLVFVTGENGDISAIDSSTGEEKWKYKCDFSAWFRPVIKNGFLFSGYERVIYALDVNNGQEKWEFYANDSIRCSPTIADNIVIFGSDDFNLYALDLKTGAEKWKFSTKDCIRSLPIVSDGIVYFRSNDKHLYALDLKTGQEIWNIEFDHVDTESITISEGVLYFGVNSHNYLYAIDALTGQEKWKFFTRPEEWESFHYGDKISLKNSYDLRCCPTVAARLVFFGCIYRIFAVDAYSGELKWTSDTKKNGSYVSPGFTPLISNGNVIIGEYNPDKLLALDMVSGGEKWRLDTKVVIGSKIKGYPVVQKDKLFFSDGKSLYAFKIKG